MGYEFAWDLAVKKPEGTRVQIEWKTKSGPVNWITKFTGPLA